MKPIITFSVMLFCSQINLNGQQIDLSKNIDNKSFNPGTLLWYEAPAKVWEEALPVGNSRLGAMVFGKNGEERIQLNEETYWSGGPYSTVVKGGYKVLPDIQKMIFEGNPIGTQSIRQTSIRK
ncbi:MAG: glycoside hydrolase N-terminal domain-containing protein [Bacteroidales bacterium]